MESIGSWIRKLMSAKLTIDVHARDTVTAMCELDVPGMIHVSTSCNDHFYTTGTHYLGADTTAFVQALTSFKVREERTAFSVARASGSLQAYIKEQEDQWWLEAKAGFPLNTGNRLMAFFGADNLTECMDALGGT